MIWRCRNCAATWDDNGWASVRLPNAFSVFYIRDGVLPAAYNIVAVVHGASVHAACGPCDALVEFDELMKLTPDIVKGHVRSALVTRLSAEAAERVIAAFELMLKWGARVDRITEARLENALSAIRRARDMLGAIGPLKATAPGRCLLDALEFDEATSKGNGPPGGDPGREETALSELSRALRLAVARLTHMHNALTQWRATTENAPHIDAILQEDEAITRRAAEAAGQ